MKLSAVVMCFLAALAGTAYAQQEAFVTDKLAVGYNEQVVGTQEGAGLTPGANTGLWLGNFTLNLAAHPAAIYNSSASEPLYFNSNADLLVGATTGFIFDTEQAFVAGDLVLSVRNDGAEKFSLDYAGNLTSAGTITSSGTFDVTGATGLILGSADVTGLTVTTDGTGTAEAILPAGSIDGAEILDDTIDFADMSDTLSLDASTSITADGTEVLSITNTGTGNSFLVNDVAGDTTPFVIDAAGNVGIGTIAPGGYKLALFGGNINLVGVATPTAPTVALNVAGILNGTYVYQVSYVTANGESALSPNSAQITPALQKVLVTIPVAPESTVTARKIWRSKAGDLTRTYLVTTVADNSTTTYLDNIADGALGIESHYLLTDMGSTASIIYANGYQIFNAKGLNLLIGETAGNSLTAGAYHNLFIGSNAGQATTLAYYNTFVGTGTGYSNTTGLQNTFIGTKAGYLNLTTNSNSYLGSYAGYNAIADGNTFVGASNGYLNTTGEKNVFVGMSAGDTDVTANANVTGSQNVFIGYQAGPASATQISNAVAIGYQAKAATSNSFVLGTSSTKVGIGTTTPTYILDVQATAVDVQMKSTTTTNYSLLRLIGGSSFLLGTEVNVGGTLIPNSTGYGGVINMANNYPIFLGTNNAIRMTILNTGNVGIGDASPASLLTVGNGDLFQVDSAGIVTTVGLVTANANLTVGNAATTAGVLQINEDTDNGTNNATFTLPAAGIAADTDYTLPVDDGTLGQVLSTDGAGVLSWATSSGGLTQVGSMTTSPAFGDTTADDDWLGLGAAAGRIEFDDQAIDEVNILTANVGIGTATPNQLLHLSKEGDVGIQLGRPNDSLNTGLKSPTATGGTYNTYTNPTNAYVSDNAYATKTNASGTSAYQSYENFAFNIPAGATINGIEVLVEYYTSMEDDRYSVAIKGTSFVEKNRLQQALDTEITYGSPTDLWETTWTSSNFSDANFYAAVSCREYNSPSADDYVDHIQVKVYYTASANWTLGIDDDDSNKFKISGSSALGTTDILTIGSGNVGIGDTSPAALLTVGDGDKFQVDSAGIVTTVGLVTANANLTVGNAATSAGVLQINEDTDAGTNNATFTLPAAGIAANTDYTLPVDDGTSGQVLSTNGTGTLSWATASSAIKSYTPTLTSLDNSITETNIVSVIIPANDIANGDMIEIHFANTWKQNTGVGQTATVKTIYGASSLTMINNVSISNNITEGRGIQSVYIMRVGNDLWIYNTLYTGYANAPWKVALGWPNGHWAGDELTAANISGIIINPGFTTEETLAVSFTLSAASASFYVHPQVAKIYKITTP